MKKAKNCGLVPKIQQDYKAESSVRSQNVAQDLVCRTCKKSFASFLDHVHHSCHPLRCSLCNELFQGDYELKFHERHSHKRNTRVNSILNISLPLKSKQQTVLVPMAAQKYSCEVCDRPLKKNKRFCKNCFLTINRQKEYNLRDKSGMNPSSLMFSLDKTSISNDTSGRINSYPDISMQDAKVELVNSEDLANTSNAVKSNKDSEMKIISTENLSEKTLALSARPERLKSQKEGQDISSSGNRLTRKRTLDSDDGNTVPIPKTNLISTEGHTRSRTLKKVRNNSPVTPEIKSDMVQIDTLIRSLPGDCGILVKPCNDNDSNFRCPKCNKVFRNFRLGSVHYSLCPKNIECSKNRKTLVSSQDVVWVCSLCHLAFSHLSQLVKHKNSCLTAGSLQPFKSFVPGSEYKSRFRRCPKCCFECVSLIKYRDHPCEKMTKQYQSVVVPLKRMPQLLESYSGSYRYFECACKMIFYHSRALEQHLRLHPHATTSDCGRTLYIARKPSVIKQEVISSNDENSPNDEQNTSMAAVVQQAENLFPNIQKTNSFVNQNHSTAKDISSEQTNAQESHSSSNPNSSFNLQSTNPSQSRKRSVATKKNRDNLAEGSVNSNIDQNAPSGDQISCTCKKKPKNLDEDIKPCMKCLNDLVNQKTKNNAKDKFGLAKIKKEVEEEVRTMHQDYDKEKEQLETENAPEIPPNTSDLDLGLTLGYENSAIALQLIQDIHADSTPPSNQRYLTPPATPDPLNVQSPSDSSIAKEPCISSTAHASQADPSILNLSPNDLASISLEKPFTDSAEFIAHINKTAPFQTQTEVFPSFESQAELSLSFQPQAEPLLPLQPQVDTFLSFQPQAESSLPFQPCFFAPADEEMLATVEVAAEREPTPVPPNIRHINVSLEPVTPDAYAMTASDNETVLRYICYHCMTEFQTDSLVDHMQNEVGKAPSEEILAIYVCDED